MLTKQLATKTDKMMELEKFRVLIFALGKAKQLF